MSSRALPAVPFLLLSSCLLANAVHAAGQGDGSVIELGEQTVVATAQEETKQAPGVSIITAEDIAKRPPSNDLSQIIRTMPGVNLTGNSSSGQRGNNRQIDIRGMGPENTLILVDGKGRDRPIRQGPIAAAVVRPGTPVVHLAPGSAQRGLQHPGGVASEGTAAARCPAGCPGPAGAAP